MTTAAKNSMDNIENFRQILEKILQLPIERDEAKSVIAAFNIIALNKGTLKKPILIEARQAFDEDACIISIKIDNLFIVSHPKNYILKKIAEQLYHKAAQEIFPEIKKL